MSYLEKTAWIMIAALTFGGFFYFGVVAEHSPSLWQLAEPGVPLIAAYTLALVVIAVVGHIVTAILSPKDANAPLDERDRRISDKAGHWSSYVLGFGVVMSLGGYLFLHNGNLLFYGVFASLMLSQIIEYAIQILLYRTGV
ncbi:MAG: hypothetical protein WBN09_01385 [Woeseiaceae bacterium]